VRERHIHPHRLGSDGYKSAIKKWKDGKIILFSSFSSSLINSVSDPRGYKWVRERAVPYEEGRLIIPSETTRKVIVQKGK
jgi:hypothetical protein